MLCRGWQVFVNFWVPNCGFHLILIMFCQKRWLGSRLHPTLGPAIKRSVNSFSALDNESGMHFDGDLYACSAAKVPRSSRARLLRSTANRVRLRSREAMGR